MATVATVVGTRNTVRARQCNRCHTTRSVTAGTLFQGMKLSLLKAFYIVYYVSTNKKGISSTELGRKLGLRQKTAWFFKQKVMKAMEGPGNFMLKGGVEVDGIVRWMGRAAARC